MTGFEVFFLKFYLGRLSDRVHNLRAECEKEVNQSALMFLGELESMIDDLHDVCKAIRGEDPTEY